MFWLQRQFNNIVETTQLTNDQMPEFYCQSKCSKCSPPAPSNNTSLQSPYLRNLLQPVDRSLWQVAPDNLKRLLEFSDCLRICFKLAVSFQHCTPHMIVHWVHIRRIWRPLVFGDEIWTIGPQPVLCWRAVLLEDESSGQPAIALKEG